MTAQNPVNIDQLRELLNSDNTIDVICTTLRITRSRLRSIIQDHKLPRKKYPKSLGKRVDSIGEEPTPEELLEIEARKQEVQARWSEKESAARRVGPKRQSWSVPNFHYNGRTVSFLAGN